MAEPADNKPENRVSADVILRLNRAVDSLVRACNAQREAQARLAAECAELHRAAAMREESLGDAEHSVKAALGLLRRLAQIPAAEEMSGEETPCLPESAGESKTAGEAGEKV